MSVKKYDHLFVKKILTVEYELCYIVELRKICALFSDY